MNIITLKSKGKQKTKEKQTLRITQDQIIVKLLQHFQYHIGESEKTTAKEIFQIVTTINMDSDRLDSYSKFYWWQRIEHAIRTLRRKDKCFIIKKKGYYFVLKTEHEAEYYKNLCDKAIERMENAKLRADDWVAEEKFNNISTTPIQEEEPPILTFEKKADSKMDTAKRKIIKLFKK